MLRRQSEKVEFWRWVLVEFERSGLSVREFCHQEGISEPSFYSWRKKISQRDNGRQPDLPGLIPVRVVAAPVGTGPVGNCLVGHEASAQIPTSVSGEKVREGLQYCSARAVHVFLVNGLLAGAEPIADTQRIFGNLDF